MTNGKRIRSYSELLGMMPGWMVQMMLGQGSILCHIYIPNANEKTAKKRRELIAGPITVCMPTFKKRETSFLKRVKKHK